MHTPLRALVLAVTSFCVLTTSIESNAQAEQALVTTSGQFLKDFAETNRFRAGNPSGFQIMPESVATPGVFFVRAEGPRTFRQDLWWFDVASGQERRVLTADQLTGSGDETLTPEELARRERARSSSRGIAGYELSKDGSKLLIPLSGRLFVVDVASMLAGKPTIQELKSAHGSPVDARFSPDGTMVACVRGGALWVTRVSDGVERRVSPAAQGDVTFGEAEFVAQEEMDRSQGYWWSPGSDAIAYQRTEVRGVETFTIADPFDPAKPAKTWPYPRAGRKNADVSLWVDDIRGIFDLPETDPKDPLSPLRPKQIAEVEWDRDTYPYMAKVTWSKDAPLCVLVQNRTQTEQVLYRVDTSTGAVTELLTERDPTWINLFAGSPRFLPDGSFLWLTEQAEHDGTTLQRVSPVGDRTDLASNGLAIQSILGFDRATSRVVLSDAAHNPGTAVVAWSLDPSVQGHERLTEPGCFGEGAQVSGTLGEGLGLWVRSVSPARGAPRWEVMKQDTVIGTISTAAEVPPVSPTVEFVSGLTDLKMHAAIIRPKDFDPTRKYAVLDFAYAGPHSNVVHANERSYLLHQWFADQGFIVVCVDGRGTPRRGRTWERAIRHNLIDAALEDHCAALEALCRMYPEMDRSRIGVNGWSFGGYFAAMAVMRRPDVYKAGVAGAPVVDWRDYDTHYTERYMGMPAPADKLTDGVGGNVTGYDASNVLTYAKDLSVPFLLIHGTADDNVYFVHSMKLCDALVRARKDFDFMPLPGQTHGVSRPEWVEAVQSRIAGFFQEHLAEP
ncbi:MAG TPA: prolyl oligopeptidase family serine peptidase [Phycisphaerales bacterium]|nr:prolyl oligopeptidase family serine peptidase [Phycisphaerales bacterium]